MVTKLQMVPRRILFNRKVKLSNDLVINKGIEQKFGMVTNFEPLIQSL